MKRKYPRWGFGQPFRYALAHLWLDPRGRTVDVLKWSYARLEYARGRACAIWPWGTHERIKGLPLDEPLPPDLIASYPALESDLGLARHAAESDQKYYSRQRWETDRRFP
jgi:hypothetical protein